MFFADLVAGGLTGVKLVTSDAHAGLVDAIAANLPGATWQRCRTHYAMNLMAVCPKSMRPGVKAVLGSTRATATTPRLAPTATSCLNGAHAAGDAAATIVIPRQVSSDSDREPWFKLSSGALPPRTAVLAATRSLVSAALSCSSLARPALFSAAKA